MKQKIVSLVLASCMLLGMTGCGSRSSINNLNSIQSVADENEIEASSTNYNLSYTEKQQMIYAQVADRELLDLSMLEKCSDNEIQQVINYMDNVDNILIGQMENDGSIIDPCFTNYLLAQFEETPYYWQRTKTTIRGIDPSSRAIIVDVDYKTIDFEKDIKSASHIVKGEPDYDKKMEVRYDRYISILDSLYRGTTYGGVEAEAALNKFQSIYGNVKDIYNEQRNLSLTENIYETGNQVGYSGVVNSVDEQHGGTMSVRYVLVTNYVLGINLGLNCHHMYVTDYALDRDFTENYELFKEEGYQDATNSVYALLYSFFTCIDESDYRGLYKLVGNFGDLDKYYADMFETTYSKHDNFSISIFDIQGTKIFCGATVSSKLRAKGSNMTYPTYTDRYYFEIELVDEALQIQECILLSRKLQGEPDIVEDEAETTGFASEITLDNDDKLDIEQLICDFGVLQLKQDTSSAEFGEKVDLSMTTSDLTALQEAMTSITGDRKVVWLVNYQQGTDNFASVKCRENFQASDNTIIEALVTYDFINKGDKWYIYSYRINSSSKLDTTNLQTASSLCLVTKDKVESYTSQVRSTESSEVSESKADITVVTNHKEYTPQLKTGTQELGLDLYTISDITTDDIAARLGVMGFTMDDVVETVDVLTNEATVEDENVAKAVSEILVDLQNMEVILKNFEENRYTNPVELSAIIEKETLEISDKYEAINAVKNTEYDEQFHLLASVYQEMISYYRRLQ